MPIGREAERLYPGGSLRSPEWRAIRRAILDRAGGWCECVGECGQDHWTDDRGIVWPVRSARHPDGNPIRLHAGHPHPEEPVWSARCPAGDRLPHPVTASRVVLTIAHLDHDPGNSDPGNLRAMCQRCHNAYDAPHRRANAARTRRRRRACGDLFRGAHGAGGAGGAP